MKVLVFILLLLSFVVCGSCFFDNAQIQEELTEIIPLEARSFYESLTENDKSVLQNVLSKSSTYDNVSQVLHDLRNGSSTLYDKAVSVVTDLRHTIASLSRPARGFVDETAEQAKNALSGPLSLSNLRKEAQAVVTKYSNLDEDTKEELKNAFPMVSAIVYNSVFQTLASGLLGITTGE